MATYPLHEFLREAIEQVSAIRRSLDGGEAIETTRSRLSVIAQVAESLGKSEIASLARGMSAALANRVAGSGNDTFSELLTRFEAILVRESIAEDELSLDLLDDRATAPPTAEDPINFEFDLANYAHGQSDTRDFDQFFTSEPHPASEATEARDTFEFLADEHETSGSGEGSAIDEFEVDPELLEIFAEEAEELLKNIDVSLENLSNDPNDSDSLWEIRRNAHTFKGSAGIVGLKQLSELAHRVEDLLDRMAEIKCGSNERVLKLLHSSTQCLKALVQGETSASLFESISRLYYDFDGVLATLSDDAVACVAEPVDATQLMAEVADPAEKPQAVGSAPLDSLIIERLFGPDKIVPAPAKNQPSRSVVRVSLDRLDDLVRVVRDMLISRSVFEQNLKSLERQIDDLHNATRRLQTTSTKLEIDFEASMMGSGSSFLPSPGIPA
ncbi:MAG TPA: Hpt domain-containing protein, partial [Pyrinomonadaceae bacterium]